LKFYPVNLAEDGKYKQYIQEISSKFKELNWKIDDRFEKNIISFDTVIKWRQKEIKTTPRQRKKKMKFSTYETFHDELPRTAELDLLNKEMLIRKKRKQKRVRFMQGNYEIQRHMDDMKWNIADVNLITVEKLRSSQQIRSSKKE
jgi:hypothetical protein